jgi:hypothetical protein
MEPQAQKPQDVQQSNPKLHKRNVSEKQPKTKVRGGKGEGETPSSKPSSPDTRNIEKQATGVSVRPSIPQRSLPATSIHSHQPSPQMTEQGETQIYNSMQAPMPVETSTKKVLNLRTDDVMDKPNHLIKVGNAPMGPGASQTEGSFNGLVANVQMSQGVRSTLPSQHNFRNMQGIQFSQYAAFPSSNSHESTGDVPTGPVSRPSSLDSESANKTFVPKHQSIEREWNVDPQAQFHSPGIQAIRASMKTPSWAGKEGMQIGSKHDYMDQPTATQYQGDGGWKQSQSVMNSPGRVPQSDGDMEFPMETPGANRPTMQVFAFCVNICICIEYSIHTNGRML